MCVVIFLADRCPWMDDSGDSWLALKCCWLISCSKTTNKCKSPYSNSSAIEVHEKNNEAEFDLDIHHTLDKLTVCNTTVRKKINNNWQNLKYLSLNDSMHVILCYTHVMKNVSYFITFGRPIVSTPYGYCYLLKRDTYAAFMSSMLGFTASFEILAGFV